FLQLPPQLVLTSVSAAVIFAIAVMFIAAMKDVDRKAKILLFIPGIRFYFRNYQTYRFSREFGYFINNGLEVKEILDLFIHQTLNEYLRYSSGLIEEKLMEGHTLSEAIGQIDMLDGKLAVFVSHGEQNSSVGKELILFSEYTLERIIMKIEDVTRKIQPVIFLILGLLIICLYLVIVLPIFQMMATINYEDSNMIKKLMNKKSNRRDDGFTLIEMLLVLLVISVLIILIIPNIAAQSANVQDTGCDAQVKMVQGQIQAYTLNEGSAPSSVSALVPDYLTNDQVTCANGTGIVIVNGQAAKSE